MEQEDLTFTFVRDGIGRPGLVGNDRSCLTSRRVLVHETLDNLELLSREDEIFNSFGANLGLVAVLHIQSLPLLLLQVETHDSTGKEKVAMT